MIELAVYNQQGQQVDKMQVDEGLLGGHVRPALLKQALVMHHANQRQGTVATKSRGLVHGSTRKLYRQKGTGRARAGASRTCVRRGGGVSFGKVRRDFRQTMPKKQRRLARNSAILSKLESQEAKVVDRFEFDSPKTKEFAEMLRCLEIDRSCLLATATNDQNVYKSLRNIPRVDAMEARQLSAGDILRRRTLLLTRAALESVLEGSTKAASETDQ